LNDATAYLIHHGYVVLFAWVAAEQLALPVPSEPVLLAAGVLAGTGLLRLPSAIAVGVAASLLSDVIWYEIGRARGSQVLRLLCRISLEPDSCVRRSQDTFARYGGWSLLVAKFVPGLNTVAQPLAGVLRMRRSRFLLVDTLGAFLWIGTYTGLGYVFSDQVERVAAGPRAISGLLALRPGVRRPRPLPRGQVRQTRALHPGLADRANHPGRAQAEDRRWPGAGSCGAMPAWCRR